MNKNLYFNLAKNNIKKNKSTFLPFTLSAVVMIAMFYIIVAIEDAVKKDPVFYGARTMDMILGFGIIVCGIFGAAVIFYTNSFLMKQRGKELGLYSILGMEKRHIRKVIFWETCVIGVTSIVAGIFFGVVFSKLMFMILIKLLHLNVVIKFFISGDAIVRCVIGYAVIFGVNFLVGLLRVQLIRPIDLLKSGNKGEKEPKAKWFSALLGMICLASGYYIAITTDNPAQAIGMFFMAVVFVIGGTYLLFMSGSIVLLKLMKKNKQYYYHKTHFISVSGMMFRMKRNAVGLANICILSTAVLVVLSSTVSLYAGLNDTMNNMFPKNITTSYTLQTESVQKANQIEVKFDEKEIDTILNTVAKENGVTIEGVKKYYNAFFAVNKSEDGYKQGEIDIKHMCMMAFVDIESYNAYVDQKDQLEVLPKGEFWIADNRGEFAGKDTFCFEGRDYKIKEEKSGKLKEFMGTETKAFENSVQCIVVAMPRKDMENITDEINVQNIKENTETVDLEYTYAFDIKGTQQAKKEFTSGKIFQHLSENENMPSVSVKNVFEERSEYIAIYGSLFFIGIFVGTMFLMTTVLIIYYKQVSEGYEDRERFEILQKVGMGKKEVKHVITTQVLQVFALPILLSGVHIAFAFPLINKILSMMGFNNHALFIGCTIGTIVVFVLVYIIVYYLTAKTYYKLVYGKK